MAARDVEQGMWKQTVTATLALAVLAACQKAEDDNLAIDDTTNVVANAPTDVETLPPDEAGGNASLPANEATPVPPTADGSVQATIPAQYQGRWGMNANDCDPKKADIAKGLIAIDAKTLKFYESRATLKEQRPAIATSFAGLFAFSGEGMTWEKVETLTVTGDTLKRADDEGTYTYKRCA